MYRSTYVAAYSNVPQVVVSKRVEVREMLAKAARYPGEN